MSETISIVDLQESEPIIGENITVFGWGDQKETQKPAETLRTLTLQTSNSITCDTYPGFDDSVICAKTYHPEDNIGNVNKKIQLHSMNYSPRK